MARLMASLLKVQLQLYKRQRTLKMLEIFPLSIFLPATDLAVIFPPVNPEGGLISNAVIA